MMKVLFELLLCHLIGDYVLQSDYVAKSKGEKWWHLIVHCLLYTVPFYVGGYASWHLFVIFAAHILIDTARARYGVISYACDQTLHIALLLIYLI